MKGTPSIEPTLQAFCRPIVLLIIVAAWTLAGSTLVTAQGTPHGMRAHDNAVRKPPIINLNQHRSIQISSTPKFGETHSEHQLARYEGDVRAPETQDIPMEMQSSYQEATPSRPRMPSHEGLQAFTPSDPSNVSMISTRHQASAVEMQATSHLDGSTGRMLAGRQMSDRRLADQRMYEQGESFIEREKSESGSDKESAQELVTRVGINLLFVLAIAFGGLLLFKQWKKLTPSALNASEQSGALRVSQTLSLSTGISLKVVEGFGNRFLIAVDSSGIKSVEALTSNFGQLVDSDIRKELEQEAELRLHRPSTTSNTEPTIRQKRERMREALAASEREPTPEQTPDIDEKLIQLLLSKSGRAA